MYLMSSELNRSENHIFEWILIGTKRKYLPDGSFIMIRY